MITVINEDDLSQNHHVITKIINLQFLNLLPYIILYQGK